MNHPKKSSMGSRRLVETSVVVWMDLLGYGSMLKKAKFDPTIKEAKDAISRLNQFQDCIARHSNKLFPSVVMNDGVALFRDLSPRSRSVTYEFLYSTWNLFKEINFIEKSNGHPGVRGVLATGFRVRRGSSHIEDMKNGIGNHLIKQVESGNVPLKQAIYTALTIRQYCDITPELQTNFAFSKAYLAEASGTRGGFEGNNLYIDHILLSDIRPDWIELGDTIKWEIDGLVGKFSSIEHINNKLAKKIQYRGACDAFEVANKLTEFKSVESRLKNLTLNKNIDITNHLTRSR